MGKDTAIEWAKHSFICWQGCTKVSAGCKNCYAEARDKWLHRGAHWGPGAPRKVFSDAYWDEPLKWDRAAKKAGERHRVFCSSHGDVFDPEAPIDARQRLWDLIKQTPNLDWLLLTKRPENFYLMLPDPLNPQPNIVLGVTVENQDMAEERLPILGIGGFKGWRTFISYEPALGPIHWPMFLDPDIGLCRNTVEQIVTGGESGPNARPPHPDYFRQARWACATYGIAFMFKQWGEWMPVDDAPPDIPPKRKIIRIRNDGLITSDPRAYFPDSTAMIRLGKKNTGRLLDAREHMEFPKEGEAQDG